MSTRTTRSFLLACTALAVAASSPASSQDATTGGATVLETIILKGNRSNGPAGDVAETPLASRTTAEEIEANQITSLEDLGRSLEPGVAFNQATRSVNIRGLEQNRVLTSIDGIPIPYLLDGARDADGGADSFDFNALSTIDIVRGADSSRAGSGALGGAVVLRTLEPDDVIGEGRDWGGIAKSTYDSEDRSFGGSVAVAKRIEETSILFQGGYRKGHERGNEGEVAGYSTTRTEPNPMDFDQYNLLFKLRQHTDSGHVFGLTAERYSRQEDSDQKTGQSPTGNYRPGDLDEFEDLRRDRLSLDYRYEATDDDAWFDSANAVFYWQNVLRNSGSRGYRSTSVIGDYSRENELEERSIGFAGNAEKAFTTGELTHVLTGGLSVSFSKASQYSAGEDSCPGGPYPPFNPCNFLHTNQSDMPDVDGRMVGIFLEDKIGFGDSAFFLTPGLRYDWYDYDPQETAAYTNGANYTGMPPGQSEGRFSPKLRASYEPDPAVELYAQWAMGFRAPDVSELYLNYGAPGTYLNVGNPNLEPETSNGFEIGANLGDEGLGGHVGAFYNRYRNFIDNESRIDSTGTYPLGITEYFNRDRVRIYGVELSVHRRFDNGIRVYGALSYADGVDLETDEDIRSVPPLKAVLGTGYAAETWGADLIFTAAKGVDDDGDAGTLEAPGYGIFDLTGWWEPEQAKGLTIRAGVYNIFDKAYYDAVNLATIQTPQPDEFYSEPGRTFKISLTQRF
ncbi:MAG TPA: TonB-dependent hemoglobin/transferrin/lactoferrin family receptor [Pseudorhizobium sp.]|nr:TonB-dependent hemoglobin/transferrin/lactoferrin family receptor [Pseudorhizobium sp.]